MVSGGRAQAGIEQPGHEQASPGRTAVILRPAEGIVAAIGRANLWPLALERYVDRSGIRAGDPT